MSQADAFDATFTALRAILRPHAPRLLVTKNSIAAFGDVKLPWGDASKP